EFEPSLPPLPKMNLGTLEPQDSQGMSQQPETEVEFNKSLTNIELPGEPTSGSPMAWDEAQIESIVREKVEATLVRLSKEMLPQIAERLIKQEIHRLLGEGP
ncbi:hypothetical protein EBZ37_08425, partial [bacterium]|nr:hypothetical protein [bacterium]